MRPAIARRRGITRRAVASAGYPDFSNTGVPSGTSLTVHNGDFTTSSNNQVIDSLDIRGSVIVNHTGVIIRKCKIWQWSIYGILCEGAGSCTIEDCEINGGNDNFTCVANSDFTALRCRVTGAENGFDVGSNVTIEDCFLYDLDNGGVDPHADGIQINDGADNLIIRHNTILSRGFDDTDTTSCIISPQASSGVSTWLIHDNVFAGGAYSLYGPQNGAGTSVTITDNKFWELYFTGKSAAFGSWTEANDEATVSGNQLGEFSGGYDSTNKLILGTWSGTPLT
jgi:hypothetical protein